MKKLHVEVHEHDGDPIDLERWAKDFVARLLELDRQKIVAPAPPQSVGLIRNA